MSATAIRSSAPSTVDPRRTASLAGWLLIITFVVSIPAALVFYTPVLDDVRFIVGPGADSRVAMGALLEMILIVANVGSAVVLFPILKRQNETLALGYVTARIIESAFIAIGIVSLLATLTLRQDFAAGAVGDAGSFVTVGMSLVAVHDWTFLLGPGWIVGVGNGLILGYLMFTSGLVPRRMAMLGLDRGPADHPLRDRGDLRRDRAGLDARRSSRRSRSSSGSCRWASTSSSRGSSPLRSSPGMPNQSWWTWSLLPWSRTPPDPDGSDPTRTAVWNGRLRGRLAPMTYVIAEPCIDVKDRACVDECPVDCIYEGPRMLYIQPDECIDCAACEPVCPVTAIFTEDDIPGEWKPFTAVNAEFFADTVSGLGTPGGAAQVEIPTVDHPTVAAWETY